MHMHGSCSRKRHAKKGIASFRKDEAHIGITGFGLVPTRSAFFPYRLPVSPVREFCALLCVRVGRLGRKGQFK